LPRHAFDPAHANVDNVDNVNQVSTKFQKDLKYTH